MPSWNEPGVDTSNRYDTGSPSGTDTPGGSVAISPFTCLTRARVQSPSARSTAKLPVADPVTGAPPAGVSTASVVTVASDPASQLSVGANVRQTSSPAASQPIRTDAGERSTKVGEVTSTTAVRAEVSPAIGMSERSTVSLPDSTCPWPFGSSRPALS